jgi:anti-sigma regulatory factor (Ser/Thr protein kinase)
MITPEASRDQHQRAEFSHQIWPANPDQLALIRAEARRWLAPQPLTEQAQKDIVLAVNEAATNAIEHAYSPDCVNPIVELTFWTESDAASIEIADRGAWRPPSPQPVGRGLGIAVMQRLMQSVVIHPSEHGTRVLLTHPLPGEARDLPPCPDRPTSLQVPVD